MIDQSGDARPDPWNRSLHNDLMDAKKYGDPDITTSAQIHCIFVSWLWYRSAPFNVFRLVSCIVLLSLSTGNDWKIFAVITITHNFTTTAHVSVTANRRPHIMILATTKMDSQNWTSSDETLSCELSMNLSHCLIVFLKNAKNYNYAFVIFVCVARR